MDVEYLREYLCVAGELNFTRAARQLCTTQSTLSKHVAALEREFGGELIRRNGKAVELTPAGAMLYRRARTIVTEYDSAKAELKRLAESTTVRVGGMLNNGEVMDVLTRLTALIKAEERPTTTFSTVVVNPFMEGLARGDADVVLCHRLDSVDECKVAFRKLARLPFELIVEQDHPLASRGNVTLDDLKDYPFVQLIDGYATAGWAWIESLCGRRGFVPRKYPIVAGSSVNLLTEPLGDAVLIVARSLFPGGVQPYSDLRTVPFDDPDAYFDLCAYYRTGDEGRLAGFLSLLGEAARQAQDSIDHPVAAGTPNRPFQTRCRTLAAEKGLTPSETEALISFAKGRSVDRIGKEMGLTRLMVADLLASVYQKVGVGDKQDLLDAIEAVRLP